MAKENENYGFKASDISIDVYSDGIEQRNRKKSPLKAVKNLFIQYCENSTIHGFQYIGQRHRTFLERFFWSIALFISFIFCTILIWNVYVKWDTSPVIVSFNEKQTPIWQIPFPAITICPELKLSQSSFNWTDDFYERWFKNELKDDEKVKMDAISQICDERALPKYAFENNETLNSPELLKILPEITPPMHESLFECEFNDIIQCDSIFKEIITEDGKCFTFNSLDSSEIYREETLHEGFPQHKINKTSKWTMEGGYDEDATLNSFPQRAFAAGSFSGMYILSQLFPHKFDYICRGPYQGLKMILHAPSDVPRVTREYFRVPAKQEIIITIRPQMIQTSEALRKYSPQRRQCYFNDERYLRFFKFYTQANCEWECITNRTLKECGCVQFFMPRHKDTPVCNLNKVECVLDAEWSFITKEINDSIASRSEYDRAETECNCLPACTSITYESELTAADMDMENFSKFKLTGNYTKENPNPQFADILMFFKENQFITSKRSELYGLIDFIANCGGLLGLFMGVSLLSIVELIYFCTVRLGDNLMKQRKKSKVAIEESNLP